MNPAPLKMELCLLFGQIFTHQQINSVDAIEVIAGTYYLLLVLMGFRNIYVIFFKQKKFSSIVFPLMYFFA